MGSEVESAAGEEHLEAVVVALSEPAGDPPVELYEPTDGSGAAVAGSVAQA